MATVIEPLGGRLGVVFGTDHFSQPEALRLLGGMGVRDVFLAINVSRDPDYHDKPPSGHVWEYRELRPAPPTADRNREQVEFSWLAGGRDETLATNTCCFTGCGIEWLEEKLGVANAPSPGGAGRSAPPRPDSPRPLTFIPSWSAGLVMLEESGATAHKVDPLRLESSAFAVPAADCRWFVSPGNCRGHTFCTFDTQSRRLGRHQCG